MVNVRLPRELIAKLDQMRGGLSRSATIRIILNNAVNGHASEHLLDRTSGGADQEGRDEHG